MSDVTIMGLGAMGAALARTLVEAGQKTVVWNRTASRAAPLVAAGATHRTDPVAAIAESPFVLVCVDNYAAADSFMARPDAEQALRGRTLIQLSSGSPRQAQTAKAWADGLGARYLDGAIMTFPSEIGGANAKILIAGDASAFKDAESLLRKLGGSTSYLGTNPGLASVLDGALLSVLFGTAFGVVNGALLCEAGGLPIARFAEFLEPIMQIADDQGIQLAQKITVDDLETTEAALETWAATLDYMSETATDAGVSDEIPAFMQGLLRRAIDAGYGRHDFAALIEVLRRGDGS